MSIQRDKIVSKIAKAIKKLSYETATYTLSLVKGTAEYDPITDSYSPIINSISAIPVVPAKGSSGVGEGSKRARSVLVSSTHFTGSIPLQLSGTLNIGGTEWSITSFESDELDAAYTLLLEINDG